MPSPSNENGSRIEISAEEGDSPEFVKQVEAVIRGLCRIHAPTEVIVVRIDNWFGKRWLRFSGKIMGLAGVWERTLTLPPFVPNRVCWERRYLRERDGGSYSLGGPGPKLHQDQTSVQNRQRLVADVVPEAALVWFSGGTKDNDHSAVMAYVPIPDGHWTWYVGYAKTDGWRIEELKGISGGELDHLVAAAPGAPGHSHELP
jgi:hypothetical protein